MKILMKFDFTRCEPEKSVLFKLAPIFNTNLFFLAITTIIIFFPVICFADETKPEASLPVYTVGTKYIYSNGAWEEVIGTENNFVQWSNQKQNTSAGPADFTFKRTSWETTTKTGTRSYKHAEFGFGSLPETLWPLQQGTRTAFEEFGKYRKKTSNFTKSYDNYFRCLVKGEERISLAIGTFDTWKITCTKYPSRSSFPRARVREYHSWYYAPLIGHWILETKKYTRYKKDKRKELVAIIPPLQKYGLSGIEIDGIKRLFQTALENNKNKKTSNWLSSDGSVRMQITPKNIVKHANGSYCRQYEQVLSTSEKRDIFPGVACRTSQGFWKIPRRQ